MTIHDSIDNFLAADLHGDLSEVERTALHTHLVECAACRKAHQETKLMNKILEETLESEKSDPAFEHRMLALFRNRIPQRRGFLKSILDLRRLRPIQITAILAVLLSLAGMGRWLTTSPTYWWLGEEVNVVSVMPQASPGSLADLRDRLASRDKPLLREVLRSRDRDAETAMPPAVLEGDSAAGVAKEEKKAEIRAGLPAAPTPVDKYRTEDRTPVEGLRQLPSFVDKADTQDAHFGFEPQPQRRSPLGFDESSTTIDKAKDNLLGTKPAKAQVEREIVTGSNIPTAQAAAEIPMTTYSADSLSPAVANRKLIRNAEVELEVTSFEDAVQKITAFANEAKGYVATTSSEKQANGKLKGEIIVKVLPENLDRFLQKIRELGELKNQTLGTEDVTKAYFDTDARLKNARVMEQRLIDMLKTKTGKVADLLAVEKELGRVREEIEKMQGDLKYWDSQVQFATVTISLAEKDLEEPAAFLLKERAQLALYSPDVEKIYSDIKGLASSGGGRMQITNAQLDRDYSGRISARLSMLIAPEESEAVIGRVKGFGRVENFQTQTERVAQGGEGMSENAKVKRDKVELNITVSRQEQEQAFQQTSLRIRASSVDEKTKQLRELTEKQSGRVRNSTFSRDPDGREFAIVSVRVPVKNYNALMQSLNSLGKVENVSVQRQDRTGTQIDEANAPADLSIQVYSQGNIVSSETGLWATLRNTLAQGAAALMWSLRMIGVALAFLAPWMIAIVAIVWIGKRVARRK